MLKTPLVFTGQLSLRGDAPPAPQAPSPPPAKVPRVSRYMALAIHFNEAVQRGEVADFADIARLGHVTRARVSQIMNLLHLAPDIQEALLFSRLPEGGRTSIQLRNLLPISRTWNWTKQRAMWRKVVTSVT